MFLLCWRPFLPLFQKLQIPFKLLLRYLCAKVLHIEEKPLQCFSGTLFIPLVILSEA